MATTLREMHRRKSRALAEISAALFFAVPAVKERPGSLRQHDRMIRSLMHIAHILESGEDDPFVCEGCHKPIRPGQHYATDDESGWYHAACCGLSKKETARMDTARTERAQLRKHIDEAREYLKSRGLP